MQLENNEQALLSCLLKKGDLIKEVTLQEEHFGYLPNQKIFQAMRQLERKDIPIDIVSVVTEIGKEIIFIGGSDYLGDLFNIITNENNFKTYERYVLEEFKIRKTKELLGVVQEIHTPKDIAKLNEAVNEISDLLEQGKTKQFDLVETLYELNEEIEKEKEDINGIPTGFSDLDKMLDGLKPEELIILAARPSVGKTAFALGITTNVCLHGDFVTFFSLEMSDKSLLTRMICSVGNIHASKIQNAKKRFNGDDWKAYRNAQGIVSKLKNNLSIYDDSKITVQQIRTEVKQNIRKHPDKRHLVVIDYLTLIHGSGRKERHLEIGEITRNLKRMARELKVPVIVLAQLNRGVEQRQDKHPMLSDLRDSGEIEQDADKVLFLHRDDYYNKEAENKNIIDVITAKQRNGMLGVINLSFVKEFQKFVNLERRYDG